MRRKNMVDYIPDKNDHGGYYDRSGEIMKCSGEYCKTCSAGIIADCIALCCCPCALINLFTLAFVKVPFLIGRRCLVKAKTKWKHGNKNLNKKKKCKCCNGSSDSDSKSVDVEEDGGGYSRRRKRVCENLFGFVYDDDDGINITFGFDGEDGEFMSARLEAEKVCLELYQVGHLGFGRVSFTGVPFGDREGKRT